MQFLPPTYWQQFEDLCCDVFSAIWSDSNTQKNGRGGQKQNGVDIFGRPKGSAEYNGVQCKGKNIGYGNPVTVKELREEVKKAFSFQPAIKDFILVTTHPKDAKIEKEARLLTKDNLTKGKFSVSVWGWEDLQSKIENYEWIIKKHYPTLYRSNSYDDAKKALLLDQNQTNLELKQVQFVNWLNEKEQCLAVNIQNSTERTAINVDVSILQPHSGKLGDVSLPLPITPLTYTKPVNLAVMGKKELFLPLCLYSDIKEFIHNTSPQAEIFGLGLTANIPLELYEKQTFIVDDELLFSRHIISMSSVSLGLLITWEDVFNQKRNLLTAFYIYVRHN